MIINLDAIKVRSILLAVITVLLTGCDKSEDTSGGGNSGKSYLSVSLAEFYFGTRDVGSSATQSIVLTNQSADLYPIDNINVSGVSAAEFKTSYVGSSTTLNPGETLQVDLTFEPTSTGRKYSSLDINHSIIVKSSDQKNELEQSYYRGKALESNRKYDDSLNEYQNYLAGDPVTDNKRRANIKVPVLTESATHGTDDDFRQYTAALDDRDANESDVAISRLDNLVKNNPDSYLADDALYMRGYIQLMDSFEYIEAYNSMQALRASYPGSSYYDTALYVEAIAQKELGNENLARDIFEQLRDRHIGMSIEIFNLQWPKDNYVSRLWFDRSNQGLEELRKG